MLYSPSSYMLLFLFAMAEATAGLGVDLQGRQVKQLTQPDTRLVVLLFVASDCPISNRYTPEIERLRKEFSSSNVAFWWVFPNPADTPGLVRQHQLQYSVEGNTILDTEQTLVRLAHVTATPESAVFSVNAGHLHEMYHGRVDDRYLSLDQERPQPAHHDLEEAISAALDGKPIPRPVTRPVGCSIVPLTAVR